MKLLGEQEFGEIIARPLTQAEHSHSKTSIRQYGD